MPAQTFVFCESSFQWLGAQFLSPHLPNGNPSEGGAGQAFSCGSLPGHVLCWPPPRWAPWSQCLVPPFPTPHPGLMVTPQSPRKLYPADPMLLSESCHASFSCPRPPSMIHVGLPGGFLHAGLGRGGGTLLNIHDRSSWQKQPAHHFYIRTRLTLGLSGIQNLHES